MSGGCFDYLCFRISDFADQVKHRIDVNGSEDPNGWGGTVGRHYSDETMAVMREAHQQIEKAARLAKEIEWLYSDDTGEEGFRESMREILFK